MPFFRRAIEIDPNFAMAYATLGRMYGDIGESALSAESTSKAYQLRDRASDQEKFFITLPTICRLRETWKRRSKLVNCGRSLILVPWHPTDSSRGLFTCLRGT